jgi:hypothetical protein
MCGWVMDLWAQAAHVLRTPALNIYPIVRTVEADSASSNSELLDAVEMDVLCHPSRESRKATNCVGRFNRNFFSVIALSVFIGTR